MLKDYSRLTFDEYEKREADTILKYVSMVNLFAKFTKIVDILNK